VGVRAEAALPTCSRDSIEPPGRAPDKTWCLARELRLGLLEISMPVAFVLLLRKRWSGMVECAKMDDVNRNPVNRNRVDGSRSSNGPPRSRGGEPDHAMEKR
jgi:hypothetical protein